MNDNDEQFNEYEYRKKRTENDYYDHSNQMIILNFENKNKKSNNEKLNSNSIKEEFPNNYQNNLNIDSSGETSNDNVINKYPNFQSFLQLKPREDVDIPQMKYYNFTFNIGSPSN